MACAPVYVLVCFLSLFGAAASLMALDVAPGHKTDEEYTRSLFERERDDELWVEERRSLHPDYLETR